jgi:hypothetical protein
MVTITRVQRTNPEAKEAILAEKEAAEARQRAIDAVGEAKQKAREAIEVRQRAVLATQQALEKEKEFDQVKRKAHLAAKELRKRALLLAEEALLKEKEAEQTAQKADLAVEDVKQQTILLLEEALAKDQQAAEAKKRAEQATEEACLKEAQATAEALKASLAAEEAGRRARAESEKARRDRELAKPGHTNAAPVCSSELIPPESKLLLMGPATLVFGPGTPGSKIAHLTNCLSENPDIRIVKVGGIAGKGSWIGLDLQRPLALYQVLYSLPFVYQLSKRDDVIQVTVREGA